MTIFIAMKDTIIIDGHECETDILRKNKSC